VFDELYAREATAGKPARVAVVGLGAGAMASYARPFETWTYYEIDPIVVRIATDPTYFTFLADAFEGTSRLRIVLGDARIRLEEEPDGSCELLVIDAFSSDAIPAHLLTREAFALYRRKLTPHGLLVAHISNRYLDLYPVLSNLATDAGMDGFIRRDHVIDDAAAALAVGWTASDWVMLVEHGNTPRALAADARWQRFAAGERAPWTDDFSDLVRAFHF
jgi:spermidine synthase